MSTRSLRNVEAGYWLTHHPSSVYRDWQFHYVFLCPRRDFELRSAYYSWMLMNRPGKLRRKAIGVIEIKTVPYVHLSHPFVERLLGTIRRECLDQLLFWTAADLEEKLLAFKTY